MKNPRATPFVDGRGNAWCSAPGWDEADLRGVAQEIKYATLSQVDRVYIQHYYAVTRGARSRSLSPHLSVGEPGG
jgi:hypothetical protein